MKKFLSSILIFILIFNLVNPMDVTYAKNSNLSDIKGHWGESYINRLVDINAISGYPDGTFKPNGKIPMVPGTNLLEFTNLFVMT